MSGIGGFRNSQLRSGVIAAIAVLALDQASKFWLLRVFDIGHRGAVKVTPFFDLVLAWNTGISYGWFQNESAAGQAILLAVKAVAVIILAVWMARSRTLDRDHRAWPDHRRGYRQRHRPLCLWRGGRFCPFPRPDWRKYLQLVRV